MRRTLSALLWFAVALLGAGAYAALAFKRGEPLNSGYILIAALCTYAIGYRFYSKWIAARCSTLDDRRATPCEVHEDGKDFVKTNKWIVFGHHFAAISGPGPLVGPVLAAQFGYLPGTLWILIGVVLGGAVQDFVILFASMRRDGKSLGADGEGGVEHRRRASIGVIAILAIMIILLAVLALVVVKALAESPWGVFTVAATIPIAMFMGGYLRLLRVGQGAGSLGDRRGAAAARGVGRAVRSRRCRRWHEVFHAQGRAARVGDHRLRLCRQRAAGLAAARAARLPQHVHEARHDRRAGARHAARAAGSADAGAHASSSMAPGRSCRASSSRSASSPSRAARSAAFTRSSASGITPKIITRESYARLGRLRRDVPGIARRDHGDDRRLHARSRACISR